MSYHNDHFNISNIATQLGIVDTSQMDISSLSIKNYIYIKNLTSKNAVIPTINVVNFNSTNMHTTQMYAESLVGNTLNLRELNINNKMFINDSPINKNLVKTHFVTPTSSPLNTVKNTGYILNISGSISLVINLPSVASSINGDRIYIEFSSGISSLVTPFNYQIKVADNSKFRDTSSIQHPNEDGNITQMLYGFSISDATSNNYSKIQTLYTANSDSGTGTFFNCVFLADPNNPPGSPGGQWEITAVSKRNGLGTVTGTMAFVV